MGISFCKIREVKTPIRSTTLSAGIDFFVPEYESDFISSFIEKNNSTNYSVDLDENEDFFIQIKPGGNILIPSGIHVSFDERMALIAFNKSSVAFKKGLIMGACVIDADYQGEIYLNLINTSERNIKIDFGKKITQFLYVPVNLTKLVQYDSLEELYKNETKRGSGGFGHTGDR